MASQRVFEDVVEDAVEVEVELEVEAYRRDRVTVDLEPAPRPPHRQRREDIDDFMGKTRKRTGCYKRRIVAKANRGEIGFVTDGKPIGRSTLEVNCFGAPWPSATVNVDLRNQNPQKNILSHSFNLLVLCRSESRWCFSKEMESLVGYS